jgi:hypothetical protein
MAYSSTATSGNILVRSTNACGSNNGGNERFCYSWRFCQQLPQYEQPLFCIGAAQPNIVFTNPQNLGVRINYYNINGGATQNIFVGATQQLT